ncbi:hypothetical protein Bbelb_329330 [Branchiostoma belcheri]|nr:hypothetical protein Bbelb_329330 [Branchiostoma belcheri]
MEDLLEAMPEDFADYGVTHTITQIFNPIELPLCSQHPKKIASAPGGSPDMTAGILVLSRRRPTVTFPCPAAGSSSEISAKLTTSELEGPTRKGRNFSRNSSGKQKRPESQMDGKVNKQTGGGLYLVWPTHSLHSPLT